MKKRVSSSDYLSWEVCLFFALYVISPSYWAIDVHPKLPLLSASRLLLVIIGIMLIVRRRKDIFRLQRMNISALNFGLARDKWLRWGLLIFFATQTVCNAVLFPSNPGEALKTMFVLAVEAYGVVWILSFVLNTRKKVYEALRILVFSSGVVALVAAVSCVLEINPFHALNWAQRDMLMTSEYRLGLIRAEAGFGHPCYYGAFCTIVSPINMYFVEYSEKKWEKKVFALCLALNITGIVLSNARGSFLTFGCVVLIAAIWSICHKEFKKFLFTYLPIGLVAILILVIVSLLSPVGLAFLVGVVKSVLNVFFPEISMDIVVRTPAAVVEETVAAAQETLAAIQETMAAVQETAAAAAETTAVTEAAATEQVISYGINPEGFKSRLRQLTGVKWTLMHKPVFGFGSKSHMYGLINFQRTRGGVWEVMESFDVGLVMIICQYGLVGLLGYTALFGSLLKETLDKKCFKDPLMRFLCFTFVIYLIHLLTIATLEKMLWVLIASIVCLSNVMHKEMEQRERGEK